jgi:hypothetical protein
LRWLKPTKNRPRRNAAKPDFSADASTDQRPKNNHSRMITGIGTPSNQSRIPRPITASSKFQSGGKRAAL